MMDMVRYRAEGPDSVCEPSENSSKCLLIKHQARDIQGQALALYEW